eukprot:TRINITY_DN1778_c0_g2_i1.p1 TRINITY_DN1778_c0_g2~~TRINITY_DN1778_c0_g2_i1.p1  ORF type:complete len:204 (+),score=27.08 TRINITY_DN1778_c0_g2_i1:117-728(+)
MARRRVSPNPVQSQVAVRIARKRGTRRDDKKRRAFFGLEIDTKRTRVAELMAGPKPMTKTEATLTAAREHPACGFSTLQKWLLYKPQRGHTQAKNGQSGVKYKELEKELLDKAIPLMRDRRKIYTSTMLADDAKDIADRLKANDDKYKGFSASAGWLRSFRDRNNLVRTRQRGEKAAADVRTFPLCSFATRPPSRRLFMTTPS